MRTFVIIVAGLIILGLFALVGWRFGGGTASLGTAAKIFLPVWFAAALVNMWIGVSRAGYSLPEELPIFLVIFAVPAIAAVVVWRISA